MPTKCFFLEPTDRYQRELRRYSRGDVKCGERSYHNASLFYDIVAASEPCREIADDPDEAGILRSDPGWPTKCAACDYVFKISDHWQLVVHQIYRRQDTGEEMTLDDAPPGAMWDAHWFIRGESPFWRGPDGRCLVVVLPTGHQWMVDGRASNCTKPDDKEHKCWCRHGEVPMITVDKTPPIVDGKPWTTCDAGGGSIGVSGYHGFLRNGELTDNC